MQRVEELLALVDGISNVQQIAHKVQVLTEDIEECEEKLAALRAKFVTAEACLRAAYAEWQATKVKS